MADGQIVIDTKIESEGIRKGISEINSDLKSLEETSEKSSDKMDKSFEKLGESIKNAFNLSLIKSQILGNIGSTAYNAIKSFATDVVAETDKLNEKLRGSSTLYGNVAVDQENLLKNLYKISSVTGESLEVLGQTVYDTMSSGINATEDMGDVLAVVEKSAKLAKAGFTDTNTAMSASLSVINAYKLKVSDLDRVQGLLLQTQNLGVTTVNELGNALSKVTATASSFGVSFEDVSTSLALMTKQGTNTEVATTGLAQIITELGKSSTTASKNLALATEQAGLGAKTFTELIEEGTSLGEVLKIMSDYADSSGKSMIDMFGSVEAGRASLQLSGANAKEYTEILEQMTNVNSLVSESFEKTVDPAEKLDSALNTLKVSIGEKITPTVNKLRSGVADLIMQFSGQKDAGEALGKSLDYLKSASEDLEKAQAGVEEQSNETTIALLAQAKLSYNLAISEVSKGYKDLQKEVRGYAEALESAKKAQDVARAGVAESVSDIIGQDFSIYQKGLSYLNIDPLPLDNAEEFVERFLSFDIPHMNEELEKLKEAGKIPRDFMSFDFDDFNSFLPYVQSAYKRVYEANQDVVKAQDDYNKSLDITQDLIAQLANLVQMGITDIVTITAYNSDLGQAVKETLISMEEEAENLANAEVSLSEASESAKESITASNDVDSETLTLKQELTKAIEETTKEYDNLSSASQWLGKELKDEEGRLDSLISLYIQYLQKGLSPTCKEMQNLKTLINTVQLPVAEESEITTFERYNSELAKVEEEYKNLQTAGELNGESLYSQSNYLSRLISLYKEFSKTSLAGTESLEVLKKKIEELTTEMESSSKTEDSWFDKLKENSKDYVNSFAKDIGQGFADFTTALATKEEKALEVQNKLNEALKKQGDLSNDISLAQAELNDAIARGNASDIEACEQKLQLTKDQQDAMAKTIAGLEDQKKSIESGKDAWKSFGKSALLALADVLEGLGAQLSAQAVSALFTGNLVSAGLLTAGALGAVGSAGLLRNWAGKYAQGGLVKGSSYSGDRLLASVNAGELILNTAQQDNLAKLITSSARLAELNGGANNININFEGVNFYGLDEPSVGKAIYENIKQLEYEGAL